MSDELVFYTNPMSRGRIVRWMLEEIGISYRTELMDYAKLKTPEFLAVNPMGKIPALTHGGRTITEVAAICAYLADAFPEAGLAPPTADRADYYRWLFFAAGPFEAAITNQSLGVTVPQEKAGMVGYGSVAAVLDVLETVVGDPRLHCQRCVQRGRRLRGIAAALPADVRHDRDAARLRRLHRPARRAARLQTRQRDRRCADPAEAAELTRKGPADRSAGPFGFRVSRVLAGGCP